LPSIAAKPDEKICNYSGKTEMKFSIITATSNSAEYIEECIANIRSYISIMYEHIIVYGGSIAKLLVWLANMKTLLLSSDHDELSMRPGILD
jgi:hypothetical protein